MKNILIIILVQTMSLFNYAQNVVIECKTNNCFFTNPDSEITQYFANITTNGKTVSSILWAVTADAYVNQPSWISNPLNIVWANTPNNPQRTVTVTVKFTDNSTVTNTQNVTVKHIAPIVSMTASIGSPSTVLKSNVIPTIQLPCGTTPFTLNVPTPITDPTQAVTYTWSLNGWGGSSTTNTIAVTPLQGGDGSITVDARRTDGSVIQSFTVNFSRSNAEVGDPTINFTYGSPITCAGHTRLMTGAAASATSFVWSPISTGIIFTPNAATGMIKFNSTTTLTLTVDNGCGLPKTVSKVINVGAPIFSEATVNGAPQQTPNYIQNPAYLSVNSDELTASFKYEIAAYNGSITQIPWSPGGKSVYAYAYPFVQIQAKAENKCGINSTMFFLYNVTTYYRMASPNPTQNTISVEMEKELGQQA